jgi:hypothetical protein
MSGETSMSGETFTAIHHATTAARSSIARAVAVAGTDN